MELINITNLFNTQKPLIFHLEIHNTYIDENYSYKLEAQATTHNTSIILFHHDDPPYHP